MEIKKVFKIRDTIGEIILNEVQVDDQQGDCLDDTSCYDTAETILDFMLTKFELIEIVNKENNNDS